MKRKTFKLEAVGSRIEIIGGTISPKEESWTFPCQYCGKWHHAKLVFDSEACEWSLIIVKGERLEP